MSRQPLVLLVSGDRLAGMTTASSLVGYGYEVLLTGTVGEAGHLLRTNRRISVLVIDTDLGQAGAGLGLAKDARVSDPDLKVIYTSRVPFRLQDAEKVSGAPCLRTPYRPHQLAGVISQLVRRIAPEEAEAYAA
jgi:DNA-binding response OmpR family regulator